MNNNNYILLVCLFFISCTITKNMDNVQVKGNGIFASEVRELNKFDEINIALGYNNITVNCGNEPSIHISGDENILPLITTEIRKGTLTISSDSTFDTKSDSEKGKKKTSSDT